jgi:hypothetical protein
MPHTHARDINASTVHCGGCHLVLAGISAGLTIIRRDRSEIVAERIHSIKCHRCGHDNSLLPSGPEPAVTKHHEPDLLVTVPVG